MVTKIADVITPEVLGPMASAEISNHLDLEKQGVAVRDYNNVDIREGGNFAEVPFYNQLDSSSHSEVLTDDTSMTPEKISTGKDIAVVLHRGKAWGSRDLAAIIQGNDPQKEIARQVGSYWAKEITYTIIQVLNAVFASTGPLGTGATAPHVKAVGVTTGTKILFTSGAATAAMQLMGDAMGNFDLLIVHSKVYKDMVDADLVSWPLVFTPHNVTPDARNPGKYLGMQIVVSDNVPVDTTTADYPIYTSYLMKKGCVYAGRQKDLMTEHDRDILAVQDILATSIHFVAHMKLCKWNTTDTNPTNALLATATQYVSVANDHKFIGAVALQTN